MLVKLGRGQEAAAYGLKYLSTTGEALALAQALRERDLHQEALQIAEHGLTLHGDAHTLACWLRDYAAGVGQAELALQAARAAFTSSPSLADYQAAQPLAGADWPQVKAELLKRLSEASASTQVNVYLHEGMVDEAVKAVSKRDAYVGYETLERVADAAYESHPDWVIRRCKAQAERIMDAGQSKYYHHAVNWLGRARRAYLAAGRDEPWRAYLEGLIVKHKRKSSLRPRLEAMRQ